VDRWRGAGVGRAPPSGRARSHRTFRRPSGQDDSRPHRPCAV
jgi:hypothetical protein